MSMNIIRDKQEMLKSPRKLFAIPFHKGYWGVILLMVPSLYFLGLFSLPLSNFNSSLYSVQQFLVSHNSTKSENGNATCNSAENWKKELERSKMAVCLVGGARRFELTGPSIVEKVLNEYPNSDLFLHSPLDPEAFKLSLLKNAPHIAAVRIFRPQPLPENESQVRVLTAQNSPNGIQGLLQYFNLVEGCLTMIRWYQLKNNFKYDWVVRTRVDGYWNAPLHPENFVPGRYVVPTGSSYGGLNDRLGIGDLRTSTVAMSRLSLIPQLDSAGFTDLNSESAFRAQLITQGVPYLTKRLPFCIISDRKYNYPPARFGVPVAALSSQGPMSGAKCRPCTPVCQGGCVEDVMTNIDKEWSWIHWENGTLELCDAHQSFENGWENIFDTVAGNNLAAARKRIRSINLEGCLRDFEQMKQRTTTWDAPPIHDICTLGLGLIP